MRTSASSSLQLWLRVHKIIDDGNGHRSRDRGSHRSRIWTGVQQHVNRRVVQELNLLKAGPTVSACGITQGRIVKHAKLCFLDAPVARGRVKTLDRIKDSILLSPTHATYTLA